MHIRNGKSYFEEVSARELADTYGTPLYVYEADRIRKNYKRLEAAFKSHWSHFRIFYAVKANSNPHIVSLLKRLGAGADCASANEIRLASKVGFQGEEILFSGNYLSDEDLDVGWQTKVLLNLDDSSLLPRIGKLGTPDFLSFRINPGIGKSEIHDSNVMAGPHAKFGIPWERAEEAYARAKEMGIRRFGVHMMTGSCVLDPGYFELITEKLLDIIGPIVKKLRIPLHLIDMGGGFGIPYRLGEHELDIEKTAALVTQILKKKAKDYGLGEPLLCCEPGRYLVGNAGWVLGLVHAIKQGYKNFVGTDIGMNILARPVLYGAWHEIFVEKQRGGQEEKLRSPEIVTICGQACENADAWAKDRSLPPIDVGDLIIVVDAGAYGFVMSYPYNGRLRAAEVLIENGTHQLIRKRETLEDWWPPQTEGLIFLCPTPTPQAVRNSPSKLGWRSIP